jgi:hypothetical protein
VEGAQDSTRRKSFRGVSTFLLARFFMRRESSATKTKLRVLRPLHHGSLASRAPVVPLPRYRGADGASDLILATQPRPSFAYQSHEAFASKNKGRRSAEKAQLSRGASPRIGCCHPNALRARPRAQRSALAFRRSTAALTAAPKRRSSIQAALHAMQCAGVTRTLAPRLSEAPRVPVVMPAGSMPGPPGSGSDEPPPAGTAPTPSVGVTG